MKEELFFETIKCFDYEVFNLPFHNERIARTIGLNIDLNEYIYPPSSKLLKCRVSYSYEGILNIDYSPYVKKEIRSFKVIYDDKISYEKKSQNREHLNQLYNKRNNADEIIIVKHKLLTDTSIANIAIFDGDNWLTPKKPLLKGTCRQRYLKEGLLIEKDIDVCMLKNAKKIALLNAMVDMDVKEDYSFLE